MDQLIFEILDEYLDGNHLNDDDDDDIRTNLETETNLIHIQVINEVLNGIPMWIDDISESATPLTSTTKNRKRKKPTRKKKVNHQKRGSTTNQFH